MASIVPRKNQAGEIHSYQVKWKDGGARSDRWQTERFDDEDSAKVLLDETSDLFRSHELHVVARLVVADAPIVIAREPGQVTRVAVPKWRLGNYGLLQESPR
ncbi:hypothetical protein ACF1BU_21565 [Streptomyces sp. NPDC014724]|uniref:hypothetical protein n=1 Tax=unclassified Streptomyces TaxID=2593676 RepID=UPI0036F5C0AF